MKLCEVFPKTFDWTRCIIRGIHSRRHHSEFIITLFFVRNLAEVDSRFRFENQRMFAQVSQRVVVYPEMQLHVDEDFLLELSRVVSVEGVWIVEDL